MGYEIKILEDSGLPYINIKDGMVVIEPGEEITLGRGIVIAIDEDNSTILWENGSTYENLSNNTEWVIFEQVGQLTPHELLIAKIKYS